MRGTSGGTSWRPSSAAGCATISAARRWRRSPESLGTGIELGFYRLLSAGGGFTLEAPDKTVDYSKTPVSARYAFTFWAFPRAAYVKNLQDYVQWADEYYKRTGFRCNMPLGSYFIRKDTSSLLSYTYDGDIISLDPIHAVGEAEPAAWAAFLKAFNEWAHQRGGIPLLNQSPFVRKAHVVVGLRRSLDDAGRLAPDGRSEPADGERVLRRAAAVGAAAAALSAASSGSNAPVSPAS